ncbi:hypothetical protein O181_081437 [Austropuccinia psidii MF-1]|uniref:Uncharacterized protein n=1 Tax=Austropuccinia psidii MF-1 TaxID=1389203 RepID=A0A9Q3IIC7_9BASI|nr:hypothetical protein [Austropuccinia psidii MF-1]
MSSKLTELTESSPSAPPPSGILSRFSSPLMASSDHFDPTKTYDVYKAVEVLDPAFTECLEKGKDFFEHYNPRYSRCHYCFIGKNPCRCTGKQASNIQEVFVEQRDLSRWTNVGGFIPVGGSPIYSSSEFPISRINTEGIVKRIGQIADSPPDPDSEGSDELDGKEVEVVSNSAGHPFNTSPSQPPSKRFQSQIIPSTPRNLQPTLATVPTYIPPASPHSSHTTPALNSAVRPSPIQQPRNSPIVTSQKLQPVASTSRKREELSPLPFSAAQVFQRRD